MSSKERSWQGETAFLESAYTHIFISMHDTMCRLVSHEADDWPSILKPFSARLYLTETDSPTVCGCRFVCVCVCVREWLMSKMCLSLKIFYCIVLTTERHDDRSCVLICLSPPIKCVDKVPANGR